MELQARLSPFTEFQNIFLGRILLWWHQLQNKVAKWHSSTLLWFNNANSEYNVYKLAPWCEYYSDHDLIIQLRYCIKNAHFKKVRNNFQTFSHILPNYQCQFMWLTLLYSILSIMPMCCRRVHIFRVMQILSHFRYYFFEACEVGWFCKLGVLKGCCSCGWFNSSKFWWFTFFTFSHSVLNFLCVKV